MKKTVFTIAFLLVVTTASFAGNNKTDLFKELSAVLRTTKEASQQQTTAFNTTAFLYNGSIAKAFYNKDDGKLIGFAIVLKSTDLPIAAQENIQQKYAGWQVREAMMYIGESGNPGYYVSIAKSKAATLVLKLNANNKPVIYTTM